MRHGQSAAPRAGVHARRPHPLIFVCLFLQALAILHARAGSACTPLHSPLGEPEQLPRQMEEIGLNSSDPLSLNSIRDSLKRQEDTIIFSLIERAKFPTNSDIYSNSSFRTDDFSGSLLEFVFQKTEAVQAAAGLFDNPEQVPFYSNKSYLSLVNDTFPKVLHGGGASINVNKQILDYYIDHILPQIANDGNDGKYASTALSDIVCLQALSRRIHCGKFVAEAKYRNASQEYEPAIRANNTAALMKMMTVEKQEDMVKRRVEKKAEVFGQEVSVGAANTTKRYKVNPTVVSDLYGQWMIPLTKMVEVDYLLGRLS